MSTVITEPTALIGQRVKIITSSIPKNPLGRPGTCVDLGPGENLHTPTRTRTRIVTYRTGILVGFQGHTAYVRSGTRIHTARTSRLRLIETPADDPVAYPEQPAQANPAQTAVDNWNLTHPVGTAVRRMGKVGRTTTPAFLYDERIPAVCVKLSNPSAAVWYEQPGVTWALSEITAITEGATPVKVITHVDSNGFARTARRDVSEAQPIAEQTARRINATDYGIVCALDPTVKPGGAA